MVATWKVESESEETWGKVRVQDVVTTHLGEETAELGQQIAKFMATLTQTGQSSGPSSAPGSPWEHGHQWGHSGRSTPSCPNSHNGRGGPGQTTVACSLPRENGVEGTEGWGGDQGNGRSIVKGRV